MLAQAEEAAEGWFFRLPLIHHKNELIVLADIDDYNGAMRRAVRRVVRIFSKTIMSCKWINARFAVDQKTL